MDTVFRDVACADRSSRAHGRPARGRHDPALPGQVLSVAHARDGRGDLQPGRDRSGNGDPGDAPRSRRSVLHARLYRRVCSRRRRTSYARNVLGCLPRRRPRVPARGLAGLALRPARARVARLHRARGTGRAPRGRRHPERATARPPPRRCGLRARARRAGHARDRVLRESQRSPAASARPGGQHPPDGVLPGRPSALAAPLPGLGTPVFRPGRPVRVGLPTTKEPRCPSTSC